MTKKLYTIGLVASAALSASASAAVLAPVSTGTYFDNNGTDIYSTTATVYGSSVTPGIPSFTFFALFDTAGISLAELQTGVIAFTPAGGPGAPADDLVLDFVGTHASSALTTADAASFAGVPAVGNVFTGLSPEGIGITTSAVGGTGIDNAAQYAVYRFTDPTLLPATNAQSSITALTLTTTVPEPSSTVLLGLGGLALTLRRRK